jgi:glucokinase-like ROK family protein
MPPRTRFRTGDQAFVRELNLSLILQRLVEHQALSRAALASATGLNKSTVSSLVQELLAMGLVHEVGLSSGSVGRPSVMLELNSDAGFIASCELGVDFIAVASARFGPDVFWQQREATHPKADQRVILNRVITLLQQAVNAGKDHSQRGLGLALGVPGLVDYHDGTLLFAPNLKWENVPLRDALQRVFGAVPIFVENEANLAALGEYFFGAAKGYDDVLFISAGVGLGGGVVRNGHLFRGKTGFASEFGHMTINPDGEPCNCGNRGCWETLVSQSALFRHIRRAVEGHRASKLIDLTHGDLARLSVPLVVEAAHAEDAVAREALEQAGRYLGIGIASLVNALNPDLVVFGGILSLAGVFILPVLEEELHRRALRWSAAATKVVLSQHGSDACVMGGVATVYQDILLHPGAYRI